MKAFWHDSPFLRSSSKRFLVIAVCIMMMAAQMFQFLSDSNFSASWNEDTELEMHICSRWSWILSVMSLSLDIIRRKRRFLPFCSTPLRCLSRKSMAEIGSSAGNLCKYKQCHWLPLSSQPAAKLVKYGGRHVHSGLLLQLFFYNNQRKSFCRGKVWRILLPFFTSFRVSMFLSSKSYSWQKSSLETDMQLIFDVFMFYNDIFPSTLDTWTMSVIKVFNMIYFI